MCKAIYLSTMDNRYSTLQVLYEIVKEASHPAQYLCTPREMILHSTFDWALINKHLYLLQEDSMVLIKQSDPISFSITEKGIEYIQLLPVFQPKEIMPTLSFKQDEDKVCGL